MSNTGWPSATSETLTLSQALKARKKATLASRRGGDPLADRRAKKSTNVTTLKAVAEDYFRRQPNRSTAQWRANLERLVYPVVGHRPITDFNGKRGPIIALIDDIKDERGPGHGQGRPDQPEHDFQLV